MSKQVNKKRKTKEERPTKLNNRISQHTTTKTTTTTLHPTMFGLLTPTKRSVVIVGKPAIHIIIVNSLLEALVVQTYLIEPVHGLNQSSITSG
ncbi:hypothetical protein BaRGS_00010050 [Batillaria attramentaria]|uniref:Uncharacterized protein n=1 Tax=Batillaria attramentaria TaxID=370345 RepID=A0ABD0LHJ8_9CAEN